MRPPFFMSRRGVRSLFWAMIPFLFLFFNSFCAILTTGILRGRISEVTVRLWDGS